MIAHQLLEVVASSVLFNISNPSIPPDVEDMFLGFDLAMVPWALVCFWLIFHLGIRNLPISQTLVKFLPDRALTMSLGFFFKILMGMMGLELKVPKAVLRHLMITPIILNASYSLYHPNCTNQMVTIVMTAVTSTVMNFLLVGVMLRGVYAPWFDPEMTVFDAFTFSSIISAVDPVSVLALMNSVEEGSPLYYLVLGGSLFNDGAAFLLFEVLQPFTGYSKKEMRGEFDPVSLGYGAAALLLDSLAGGLLGILSAYVASLIIKGMKSDQFMVSREGELTFIKPLVILLMVALPYVISLTFGFSMAVCLIVYGVSAEWFTSPFIELIDFVTITGIMRGLSGTLQSLIYFYIGTQLPHLVNTIDRIWKFALIVLVLIKVSRALVLTAVCNFLNQFVLTSYTVDWKWQLIWVCGGMRGAVAYAMVYDLQTVKERKAWGEKVQDTILFIIILTTLLYGTLVKVLARILDLSVEGRQLVAVTEG